nr:MAG TPA: hypothetical protein [Caudoviricetes sp.]
MIIERTVLIAVEGQSIMGCLLLTKVLIERARWSPIREKRVRYGLALFLFFDAFNLFAQ